MKKTFRPTLICLTILTLIFSVPGSVVSASANDPLQTQKTSPEGLLNADGTLNLKGGFQGTLDLSGWDVQVDPQRGPIFAPESVAPGQWASLGVGTNGSLNNHVSAIAVSGTDVYVGGSFYNVNNNGTVLPAADVIAKWDGSNWSALGSNGAGDGSLYNGHVDAIAVSGTDIYVGGTFTNVNSNGTILPAADYVAKWDGSSWSALGSNGAGNGSLNYGVSAIAVSGTDVYVGGDFYNVNNSGTVLTAADFIAKWNGSNWSALGSNGAGNGSIRGYIRTIAVSGVDIYVGGGFKDVNNNGTVLTAADYVAKWNGSAWSALGSNGAGDGSLRSFVYAIAMSGANVYVGGGFVDVNNNGTILPAADYIAKWNGSTWSALGSNGAGNGSLNHGVSAIAVSGANIYIGGSFKNINNNGTILKAADYIAKWNGTSWSALGSGGADPNGSLSDDMVHAIAISGANIYPGGFFDDVNNNGTVLPAADYIAKWNGSSWSALGSSGVDASIARMVSAIAVNGTDVYVGGWFKNVNNNGIAIPAADYIAKWNGSTWSALGSNGAGNGSLNGYVNAIAVSGTDVYVGGWFTNVNNNGTVLPAADYIAKWNGSAWSALGSNGKGNGSIPYGQVYAIAVSGANVYVGGSFQDVNNNGTVLTAADYFAKWNGSSWSALGSNGAGNGSFNKPVSAIAVSGTNVYVGGAFTDVTNSNGTILAHADYIVRWNGTAWLMLGSNGDGNGSLNKPVYAIAISGTDVYVGGAFTDVTNSNGTVLPKADYIAKWNGGSWSALGSNGASNGSLNGSVVAIAVSGTNVYVSGSFKDVNNNGMVLPAADGIAKWNGSTWSALGSNGAGNSSFGTFSGISIIAITGANLYAGGTFNNVNNNGTILPAADFVAMYGLGAVPTATQTPTRTATATQTSTATMTPSSSATVTETMAETPTETMTETPTPTQTIGASPTETPTPSPTGTMTETMTATVILTETPTVTPTQTVGASPTP